MTSEEIEIYRLELVNILVDDYPTQSRQTSLKELARKVGASTTNRYKGHGEAGQAELVDNISTALQTASMIDACRTASKNYDIAVAATKAAIQNYRIAAAIAILSMLAAWSAVIVIVLIR